MATEKEELARKLAEAANVFDEVKHDLRLAWHSEDARDGACRAASGVARIGAIVAALVGPVVLLVIAIGVNRDINKGGTILCLLAFVFSRPYSVAVGAVSGRIAHRFAYQTDIPPMTLAKLLAWIVNVSMWLWIVVITVNCM